MINKFIDIINWIDLVTKVGGWFIVLIAIFILFGKQVLIGNLIYKFFKLEGISHMQSMAIAFISRDNCIRNARLFMEYVILTNEDGYLGFKSWKNKILNFKSSYIEDKENDKIEIENTFVLINEIVKGNIERYFNFINENANKFSANEEDANKFLLNIHIKHAYLSPFIQITSLQERYNQDWSKLLEHYATAFTDKNNKKYPTEVSSFYTWLMWGPSVCIVPSSEFSRACLLGLGDESMAVPVIIPAGQELAIWDYITDNIENNVMGLFVVGDYKLYNSLKYIKRELHKFEEKTLKFANATLDWNENGIILETTNNVQWKNNAIYSKTIFFAYIWIMLYYYNKGEESKPFDCKNATVLFEHANITDSDNVDFLTNTLVDKCIQYLKNVYADKEYENRIYTVPWAINDKILNIFKEKVSKEKFLKNKIILNEAKISQESILSSIDSEYNNSTLNIEFINIDFNNKKHLALLARFYYELYIIEFPDENERETIDNIIKQAKRMEKIEQCEYHCIVAMQGDEIVGGIIGDYFAECNSGAIEFIVVDKTKRNLHIATSLIANLNDSFNKDAKKYNRNITSIDYCFFETENPDKVEESQKENSISRLRFWNKKFAYKVGINYYQMPLDNSKDSVDYLYLALIIVNEKLKDKNTIDKNVVKKFVNCYFRYAFQVDNVDKVEELKKMNEELNKLSEVKIEKLI